MEPPSSSDTSGGWVDPSISNCFSLHGTLLSYPQLKVPPPLTLIATYRGWGSPGRPITRPPQTSRKAPWPRSLHEDRSEGSGWLSLRKDPGKSSLLYIPPTTPSFAQLALSESLSFLYIMACPQV